MTSLLVRDVRAVRPGAGRVLALTGLWIAVAAVSADALVSTATVAVPATYPALLAVAATVALVASSLATVSTRERVHRGDLGAVVVLLMLQTAIMVVGPARAFEGEATSWVLGHLLVVGLALAARRLTVADVYRVLLVTCAASWAMLALGTGALSADVRSLPLLGGRLTGVFAHPNVTGMAAALLVTLSLARGSLRKVGVFVGVATLAASYSLTGIVAAVVGVAVGRYLPKHASRVVTTVLAVLTFALPGAVFLGSRVLPPDLFTGRVTVWAWAGRSGMDLWWGEGTAVFDALRHSVFPVGWFHAHNGIVTDLLVGGVPLAVVGYLLLLRLRAASRTSTATAVWVVVAACSITEVPLFIDYPGARALTLGLAIVVVLRSVPEEAGS